MRHNPIILTTEHYGIVFMVSILRRVSTNIGAIREITEFKMIAGRSLCYAAQLFASNLEVLLHLCYITAEIVVNIQRCRRSARITRPVRSALAVVRRSECSARDVFINCMQRCMQTDHNFHHNTVQQQ